MEYQQLKYVWKPAIEANAYTILLLHGTGGDEHDLLPLAKDFGDRLNILSLRGNVSEGGMPRFFRRLGMGIFDEKDLAFRTHEMVSFIKELAGKENFDASKIIALGYSNGANIAGSILVLYPSFLAGAILYRPMQPFKIVGGGWKVEGNIPVFMSNGAADSTIGRAATKDYAELLKTAGFNVEAHELQSGHQLTQQDIQLSVEWFNKNFGNGGL